MRQLVRYPVGQDSSVVVEAELPESGIQPASRSDGLVNATQTLEEALDQVKAGAHAVVTELQSAINPDELTVQFGIKLGAKVGAVIAATDVEANFVVTLAWKHPH